MGQNLFSALINANKQRNVTIRIVQNNPSAYMPANDTSYLQSIGAASVRSINWPSLFDGFGSFLSLQTVFPDATIYSRYGILHTKFMVVDNKHFYLGSANFDWRSMAQVKELGTTVKNCAPFATDLDKIFEMYWQLAVSTQLPTIWPTRYAVHLIV